MHKLKPERFRQNNGFSPWGEAKHWIRLLSVHPWRLLKMWLYNHWATWSDFTAYPAFSWRLDWRPPEVPSSLKFSIISWSTKCNESEQHQTFHQGSGMHHGYCLCSVSRSQQYWQTWASSAGNDIMMCLEHIISLSLAQNRETMAIFSESCGWRRNDSACI